MEELQFNNNQVQPLNFKPDVEQYPETQTKRDLELQAKAGEEPTSDLEGLRNRIDAELLDLEWENVLNSYENLLSQKDADPRSISESLKSYNLMHGLPSPASSLEEAAANRQAEEAFENNTTTYLNQLLDFRGDEVNADTLAKAEITETSLEELEAHIAGDNPWVSFGKRAAYDLLTPTLMQTFISKGMVEDLGIDYDGMSYTELWTNVLNVIDEKSRTLSVSQFQEFMGNMVETLKQTSPIIAQDFVDVVRRGVDRARDPTAVVEVASVVRGITRLFKGASAAKMSKVAGDTKKTVETVMDAVEKGTDKTTILEDAVTHTAMQPTIVEGGILSASKKVEEHLAETLANKDALRIIDSYSQNRFLTPDQKEMAVALESAMFKRKYESVFNNTVDILDVGLEETETGAYETKFLIGTGFKGTSPSCVEAALLDAKRLGLPEGSYKPVKVSGAGVYLEVTRPLKYDTLTTIGAEKNKEDWYARAFGRWLRGSTGITKEAHEKITVAARQFNAMHSELMNKMRDIVTEMSRDEYKRINSILKKGSDDGVWYTDKELLNFGCTEKEVEFANQYRLVNDIEDIARNDFLHNNMVKDGWVVGGFDQKEIVKDVSSTNITLENFKNMVFKDNELSKDISAEKLNKLLKDNKVRLYKVHPSVGGYKDLNYNYLIANIDYPTYELPRFLTNYLAGGRRMYTEGSYFVKSGNGFKRGDAIYNGFARTLRASEKKEDCELFAKEANVAREIFNDLDAGIISAEEAEAAIILGDFKAFKVRNLEDLKSVMKSDTNKADWLIDPKYEVQVVRSGEKYQYTKGIKLFEEAEDETDAAVQDLINSLADHNTRRGEILKQVNGDEAKTLNVAEVYDKMVNKATATLTGRDAQVWFGQQFRKNYSKYVVNGDRLSDTQLLSAPLVDIDTLPDAFKKEWRMAKNMQMRWDRFNNSMTDADKAVKRFMNELAHDILGDKILKKIPVLGNSRLTEKALDKLAKTEPIAFSRHMQFMASMGFYNIKQLWTQGVLGSLNTWAIAPKEASKFAVAHPSLYSAMTARLKGAEDVAKECIKTAAKLTGESEEDISRFVDFANSFGSRYSISNKVGSSRRTLSQMNKDKVVRSSWNKLINSQYYFTEAGNNYNQTMADFAAFFQNKGKTFAEIAGAADDFFLNMTKGSESYLQTRMFGKLITQWLTYPMRLSEAMFSSKSRLTKGQRVRLAAMQMIGVGGIAGTFFGREGQLWSYKAMRDVDMPDSVADIASSGTLHYIGKQLGVDLDEGAHLLDNVSWVMDLFSEDSAKPLNILNNIIPASAAYGTAEALVKTTANFFMPETDITDTFWALKEAATMPHQVGGVRNVANFLVALNASKVYNGRQDILKDNVSWQEAGKYLLGFKPVEKGLNNALSIYYKEPLKFADDYYKEELEPLAKQINSLQEFSFDDPMEAKRKRDELINRYSALYRKGLTVLQETFRSGPAVKHLANKSFKGFLQENALDANMRRTYIMNPTIVNYLKDYSGVE